jgi:hypothetical protein
MAKPRKPVVQELAAVETVIKRSRRMTGDLNLMGGGIARIKAFGSASIDRIECLFRA